MKRDEKNIRLGIVRSMNSRSLGIDYPFSCHFNVIQKKFNIFCTCETGNW